jgi:hypothetical protein
MVRAAPTSACRIDDDRRLRVDRVVVGVGKEGMPFVSADPLRGLTPTETPRARRNKYRPTRHALRRHRTMECASRPMITNRATEAKKDSKGVVFY